jgi:hypothetical protein
LEVGTKKIKTNKICKNKFGKGGCYNVVISKQKKIKQKFAQFVAAFPDSI